MHPRQQQQHEPVIAMHRHTQCRLQLYAWHQHHSESGAWASDSPPLCRFSFNAHLQTAPPAICPDSTYADMLSCLRSEVVVASVMYSLLHPICVFTCSQPRQASTASRRPLTACSTSTSTSRTGQQTQHAQHTQHTRRAKARPHRSLPSRLPMRAAAAEAPVPENIQVLGA